MPVILKPVVVLVFGLLLIVFELTQAALPFDVRSLPTLAPMLDEVTPAVVNISAIGEVKIRRRQTLFDDPFFQHFFQGLPSPKTRKTRSLGSGVIVDAQKGYVLTNHHVVEGGKQIIVNLKGGRQVEAHMIGSDSRTDIAVLQIPAKQLKAIPLSDSDQLRVGDFAVAIGNPFGLGQTVTSGIISALGRSGLGLSAQAGEQSFEEFIQTDAAINIGNSGGALVNLNGELIGINTAILSPNQGGNVGIGFAIPINMAKAVMEQLISHGEIRRGYFGVVIQTLTPELAQAIGTEIKKGVIIAGIEKDSPAEKSGLQVHDIVTEVNGQVVKNATEMRNRIGVLNVGDAIRIEAYRGTKKRIFLGKISGEVYTQLAGEKLNFRLAGAIFADKNNGMVVVNVEPGSPAAKVGLQKGDRVVSINRQAISNLQQAQQVLRRPVNQLLINIQRGRSAFFLLVR